MAWWVYALASAFAAAFTAILAKIGVEGIPSNLATAVRTTVVVVFAWLIAIGGGEHRHLSIVRGRDKLSLALTIFLAWLILAEHITWKVGLGATLMVLGALLTLAG
jgi:transporter family protein